MHTEQLAQHPGIVEPFLLDPEKRGDLWQSVIDTVESYINNVRDLPVSTEPAPEAVRSLLNDFDFSRPLDPVEAVKLASQALSGTQVHTPHPRYFGLFNPTPTTMGVAADAIVAALNPQLGAWRHNPFAVEVERRLIQELGSRFGYSSGRTSGVMTSGGSEANHTAVLAALVHGFPDFEHTGLRGLSTQPVLYVSSESHHSLHKAARFCGLGANSVRAIPVNTAFQMETSALASSITEDRDNGLMPFLIVGTAGTTSAGVIDPLREIAEIAAREKLWFHADAAWGGAVTLVPELRPLLAGIERANSITVDAHKWLSVPMGAGIFLTSHPEILYRTFHISAAYIPPQAAGIECADPYESSMQWSRRFIGLKLFLSLAVAGWDGYARIMRHMSEMGRQLRRELESADWEVVNATALPICCFRDRTAPAGSSEPYLNAVAQKVVASGKAWISTTRLQDSIPVLRACITSYRTNSEDLKVLISVLEAARTAVRLQERNYLPRS